MESRLNCLARPAMSSSPRPVSARPDADVGGGLVTDRLAEATGRLLGLAVQVPLWRGDDVEESQLRVSPATATDDECVEFLARWCLGERSVCLHRLWQPRNRSPGYFRAARRAVNASGRG